MIGRIGSWKGMDVIKVGKYDYDTSSEIRPKKYIYAVYNLIGDGNTYLIKDRPPMVLLSKEQIQDYVSKVGFTIIKIVDEHITDVGGGKRNVYTILLKK